MPLNATAEEMLAEEIGFVVRCERRVQSSSSVLDLTAHVESLERVIGRVSRYATGL